MRPLPILTAATAVALLCSGLICRAQSENAEPQGRPVPSSNQEAFPFAVLGSGGPSAPVAFQAADQMSRTDQDLLANEESSLQEKAGVENLDYQQSGWKYRQIVCPAFPNHLFLQFSRDDGSREMSMFSAAIPRGGDGKMRIIPILRKGYSLFSPAPINSLTIAAFNQIRADEEYTQAPDWVGTGECYVALTGGDPTFGGAGRGETADAPIALAPTLELQPDGDAAIHIAARDATSRTRVWSLSFDRKGRLLKARHSPDFSATAKTRVVPTGNETTTRKVPE